jgi:hypothetical protein
MAVKITYRGWPGHFILGHRCNFHLNTLIEYKDVKIVVSTVGMLLNKAEDAFEEIGHNRYYETMAFYAEKKENFYDADVCKPVEFESRWCYNSIDDEWEANKGHWKVVAEISDKLESGEI